MPGRSQFDSWGQIPPGLVAMSQEVDLKERYLHKSTVPHRDVLVPSCSLKILLSNLKDKIYKHESGYYGLITGLVVAILGLLRILTREE